MGFDCPAVYVLTKHFKEFPIKIKHLKRIKLDRSVACRNYLKSSSQLFNMKTYSINAMFRTIKIQSILN